MGSSLPLPPLPMAADPVSSLVPTASRDALAALAGLSEAWEQDHVVRRRLLWDGFLCKWPTAEATGIASYASACLNYDVLKHFFESWAARVESPKSPSLSVIKQEA